MSSALGVEKRSNERHPTSLRRPISLFFYLEDGELQCVKAKKESLGIKQKMREEKKRERRISLAVISAVLVIVMAASGFLVHLMLSPSSSQEMDTAEAKAAIVDQLSLTFPNKTFIENATNILEQAGYTVDYFPGEKVTVDFFSSLPTHRYKLIILRVHSSATNLGTGAKDSVVLFTSESYDTTKHINEQLTDRLKIVTYTPNEGAKGPLYFGICPAFIAGNVEGHFRDAVIIMMGCEGLVSPSLAKAFQDKNAQVCIGWNGSVSASHTDQATLCVLDSLFAKNQTIGRALQKASKELGADPTYDSQMTYYPYAAGDQTIEKPR